MGDKRHLKEEGQSYGLDDVYWIQRAWDKSHLTCNWCQDFLKNSIPPVEVKGIDEELLSILLDELPKVKNPRPDLYFGTSADGYNAISEMINKRYSRYSMISRGLYHAAFAVKAKGVLHSIEEAENQSCRDGATMVYARRRFNTAQYDEAPSVLGPDLDSICFTMSLITQFANIHVYWAEVHTDKTLYHMSLVKGYALQSAQVKRTSS